MFFKPPTNSGEQECDQIYYFDLKVGTQTGTTCIIESQGGRTTCSFFVKANRSIVFASTHEANASCPHVPERRADGKYIWPIYETF
ncbi:MAG: hypothetical protein IPN86_23865 [Saprospiraceae bacterium]|nr:hypothetical protein [Saprospiraceae bacterium]